MCWRVDPQPSCQESYVNLLGKCVARLSIPVLALSKKNSNAIEILTFLHKLADVSVGVWFSVSAPTATNSTTPPTWHQSKQVLVEYFKELEEESIRDNFVIVYELLDEMMDFGYPQTTESKILQEYITQESHKLEVQARPPMAVTNAVSWRSEGIRYRKNEVFLDVVEIVNLLVRLMSRLSKILRPSLHSSSSRSTQMGVLFAVKS